ncbi:MAG TPA: tetratricopeptide repeat protein [Fimbriimonadaceae bacterium]|nr:tetratricopeptide repeat protein [Fimbriimonadaceae bacterium]
MTRVEITDGLQGLIEKSLVQFDAGRYTMLESVRAYARAKLEEEGESRELTRRHAEHFVEAMSGAEEGLQAGEQALWTSRIETEESNLRLALNTLLGDPEDREAIESARRLLGQIWRQWTRRGGIDEGLSYLSRAGAGLQGEPRLLATIHNAAGILAVTAGDRPEEAERSLLRALEIRKELGEPVLVARTLNNLAMLYNDRGRLDDARDAYHHARDLLRGERGYVYGTILLNLGNLERYAGRDDHAMTAYLEALEVLKEAGDIDGEGLVLNALGILYEDRSDPATALGYHEEAYVAFSKLGNERMQGWALGSIGGSRLKLGDRAGAESAILESTRLRLAQGDPRSVALALELWIEWLAASRRFEEASTALGTLETVMERVELSRTPAQERLLEEIGIAACQALGRQRFNECRYRGMGLTPSDVLANR